MNVEERTLTVHYSPVALSPLNAVVFISSDQEHSST